LIVMRPFGSHDITTQSMLRTTLLRNMVRNRRRKAPTVDDCFAPLRGAKHHDAKRRWFFCFYSSANGQRIKSFLQTLVKALKN
jgi:hypothetical protein